LYALPQKTALKRILATRRATQPAKPITNNLRTVKSDKKHLLGVLAFLKSKT